MEKNLILQPLRKRNLYEDVIRILMRKIYQGQLSAGDKLPGERDLAKQLEINRATVREALRIMEYMQVIEKRAGDGIYVTASANALPFQAEVFRILSEDELDSESLAAANEAIILIESAIGRLAAVRRTDEELAKLKIMLEDMRSSSTDTTPIQFAQMGKEFHLAVGQAAKSSFLYSIASTLWMLIIRYTEVLYRVEESREKTIDNLQQLLYKIEIKDELGASEIMEHHYSWGMKVLFDFGSMLKY